MRSSMECGKEIYSQTHDFDWVVRMIREGEGIAKGPDLFWRELREEVELPRESGGELRIMRRWNSHTPSVYDVLGGGYFLRWKGRGTVIDPGYGFLKLFRRKTRYRLEHIDMVIATHDHLDHCQDLAALIALFRKYNEWSVELEKKPPKVWDMVLSYGIMDMYSSMLKHPDNAPFLFRQWVLPNEEKPVTCRQDIPQFLSNARGEGRLNRDSYLLSFCKEAEKSLSKKYSYKLAVLPAYHRELLGAMTAFGLKIKLNGQKGKTIVISGDTAINSSSKDEDTDGSDLSKLYEDADLLILHVGGLEKKDKKRGNAGAHLGIQGILEVLSRLKRKPKMVVLTEWGYEFGRIGVNGRTAFVRHVADKLKGEYYAAVETEGKPPENIPKNGIPIIPADIGLRISLPDLKVECVEEGSEDRRDVDKREDGDHRAEDKQICFEDCRNIYAREVLEEIEYCAIR